MTRISDVTSVSVQNSGLLTERLCNISEQSARLMLPSFERDQKKYPEGAPPGISPQLLSQVIVDLRGIIKGYESGEIVYESDKALEPESKFPALDEAVEETETAQVYKPKVELPKAPDLGDRRVKQVSEMDFDALFKELPFGKIDPSMPGVIFLCDELRIPVPGGYITERGHADYLISPFVTPPFKKGGKQFLLSYPNVLRINKVPMPLSTELTQITRPSDLKVAVPIKEDPLVWRVSGSSFNQIKDEIEYKIRETSLDSPFVTLDPETLDRFKPTKDEQEYWQEALPLPQRLRDKLLGAAKNNDHEEAMHLITSYIGRRDKTTGLTNFRYVCHPRFGEFMRNNPDDMPLIVSELKVGHCDLLSWYTAAQGRGYGIPVWVTTDLLTIKDGSAFNSAYLHSRNVFPTKGGKLLAYDPTIHCNFDKAYHPKILKDDLVDELERNLHQAESVEQKVRILREFNLRISELRKVAEADKEVLEDTRKMQLGTLAVLFVPKGEFDPNKTEFRGEVVNWEWLPKEVTQEALVQVSECLAGDLYGSGGVVSNAVLFDFEAIDSNHPRDARRQVQYLYNGLAKLRVPIYEQDPSPCMLGLDFFNSSSLTFQGLCKLHKEQEGEHGYVPCLGVVYVQRFLDQTNLKDLVKYLKSSESDERIMWGMEQMLELSLLPLIRKGSTECIKRHRYSSNFKSVLRDGQILNLDGDVHSLYVGSLDDFSYDDVSGNYTVEEIKQIKEDIVNFIFEFQLACVDSTYRGDLLKRLGINELVFRRIALLLLEVREDYRRGTLSGEVSKKETMNLARTCCAFYLDSRSQETFRRSFTRLMHELDSSYKRGRIHELDDFRPYVPGDDIKKVNWKMYGRTDRFYVQLVRRYVKDLSTPLYVLFDYRAGVSLHYLRLLELIRNLQIDSRTKGREIYAGVYGNHSCTPGYYLIPDDPSVKAEDILPCLFRDIKIKDLPSEEESQGKTSKGKLTQEEAQGQGTSGPFLLNGRLPPNLLYVSSSYGRTLAFQYLYGRHKQKCNLKTLWLSDDRFMVYPLIKDSWVENGYPEHLV